MPANYSPDQEVTLTVTLSQANRGRYGFQLTAIDDSGKRAGDFTPNDNRTQTQLSNVLGNQRQYINHTFSGTSPSSPGQGSWTFKWKAPAQSVGRVTFYVAGNAANNDGSSNGDSIYTTSQSIQPPALAGFNSVSAASFAVGPLTANGIAAGFGPTQATGVVLAPPGTMLPTNLDGTSVVVRDSMGTDRDAGLFVITPDQANFLIPTGTANGAATITLRRNGTPIAQGTATIDTISPSVFSANSNGRGVAAAYVLRRRFLTPTMFVDTNEAILQFNQGSNQFEPLMIDLGPESDQVFLILFGTGFSAVTNQPVSATIGGVNAPVVFAGAQGQFFGVDQANIGIPRALIGRNAVLDVVFSIDNKTANTVQIGVK